MIVKKALIIDSPWIEKILAGDKVWEMRSTRVQHRGLFGLIQKGSGQVKGIATLHTVSGPYNNDELAQHFARHHVGPEFYESPDYKWRYAWELSDAISLPSPVNYQHKNGAVTWVDLNEAAVYEIAHQLGQEITEKADVPKPATTPVAAATPTEANRASSAVTIPIARDGTAFSPDCNRKGVYTVGDKGDERRFNNYYEALDYLKAMPTARWRRPNDRGNWGIVSAIEWIELEHYEATR